MTNPPLPRGSDGFYHPENSLDVSALVTYAGENGLKIRARGATHSVAHSIYTDPVNSWPPNETLVETPPAGNDINIAFDKMRDLVWSDEFPGQVEVGAGCNLGRDPMDPFGVSTLENSFLYQAAQKGWAVDIVGGITHQTVSGFTGTGSAGGSTQYAFDNVIGYEVVDGLGNVSWINEGDPEFGAMLTHLGLLGIVTRMRFQLVKNYYIEGTQTTTLTAMGDGSNQLKNCPIDMFGDGRDGKPSMGQYLTEQPYSRITWWPQEGAKLVQIWQADRLYTKEPIPPDQLKPFLEIKPTFLGQAEAVIASAVFVLCGNSQPSRIFTLLKEKVGHYFTKLVQTNAQKKMNVAMRALQMLGGAVISLVVLLGGMMIGSVPGLMHKLFKVIMPNFAPFSNGKPETFRDYYWRSLCMDNTADDVLLSTEFTEIWVPMPHATQAMQAVQDLFEKKGDAAIGWYAQEIYAAKSSSGWMNPSYSDGSDEYKDGVIRFDVYWFRSNDTTPNGEGQFFSQYWDMFRAENIPFRLHWGKFVPAYDFEGWAAYYQSVLPKFDDFMELRAKRDPKNIFFTTYWQERLLGKPLATEAI